MKTLQKWHEKSVKVEQALRHLHLLITSAGLYSDVHPRFVEVLAEVVTAWQTLLRDEGEIELKQIANSLVYDGAALQGHLNSTQEFTQMLKERGLECLVFQPGLTTEEMLAFAHYMALSQSRRKQLGAPGVYLAQQGVHHIDIWKLGDLMNEKGADAQQQAQGLPAGLNDLQTFRQDNLRIIKELYQNAKLNRTLDLDSARAVVGSFMSESVFSSDLLMGISSIRAEDDEYTCTHAFNAGVLSICLARYLGLEESVVADIGMACLLLDIGKMFVPDAILNKPGRLTAEEWAVMESHPTLGARFLLSLPNMVELAPIVAYEHHMNLDGSGYPCLPMRHEMSLASQIASLVDFYDAVSTARPYKRAALPSDVVALLKRVEDRTKDPRLKAIFLEMLGNYPIGSVVRLNTGELAVVSMTNQESPLRPEVYIVSDVDGKLLPSSCPLLLGELNNTEAQRRNIVEAVDPIEVHINPMEILQKGEQRNR